MQKFALTRASHNDSGTKLADTILKQWLYMKALINLKRFALVFNVKHAVNIDYTGGVGGCRPIATVFLFGT